MFTRLRTIGLLTTAQCPCPEEAPANTGRRLEQCNGNSDFILAFLPLIVLKEIKAFQRDSGTNSLAFFLCIKSWYKCIIIHSLSVFQPQRMYRCSQHLANSLSIKNFALVSSYYLHAQLNVISSDISEDLIKILLISPSFYFTFTLLLIFF